MTPDELAVLLDAELSPAACRVALYVASLGAGAHEVKQTKFSALLNHPGEKAMQVALRIAVESGYLIRTPGGRGHSDLFEFRYAPGAELKDRSAPGAELKPPVVVEEEEVKPPSPPLTFPLSAKATKAISDASAKLEGCRDALRDYLQARVPEERQYAYVQSVVSWLDNPKQVFQQSDGMPVPQGERVKLLATALNEMAATDESGYAAPSGDVRNVKSKLYSLARGFGKKSVQARASPRDKPADAQEYTPTETWGGFNG